MAAEQMSWVALLFDKMSGPAKRIGNALQGLHTDLKDTSSKFGKFAKAQDLAGGAAMTMGSAMGGIVGLVAAAGVAWAGMAYAIGSSAFPMFAFKESALATGKALWGSAEAAQEMFTKASQLARLTPFNVQEVVGGFNKLGAAGFGKNEVPVVFQGLADIASMSGKGAEAIGSLTLAFSQIMGRGRLQSQELNQITEAAGGAVSRLKLFKEIAKIMGVAETSIESMMENGLIPARVAIMGVMQVSKQLGGGVIGQNSIEQSKTLGGLWSNLQDTITNLWLTMDLSNAPWFKTVKGVMNNLIDLLDTSSESGAKLQATFGRIFANFFGEFATLGTPEGLQKMATVLEQVSHGFAIFMNMGTAAFSGLWSGMQAGLQPLMQLVGGFGEMGILSIGMRSTFEALGKVIGYLALGFGVIFAVVSPLVVVFSKLVNLIITAVNAVVGGLFEGLLHMFNGTDTWSTMKAVGSDMGTGIKNGFAEALEIKSPSKVFAGYGENVVEGFNRGVDSLPGMDATLATDLAAGTSGGVGRSAGGGVSVALTVNLNGSASEDADSIAHRVAEVTTSTLTSFFDQLAAERGVA